MKFSTDTEMQKLACEANEFFDHVLHDEEPCFVSDEATIFDVSMSTEADLIKRVSEFYRQSVGHDDLMLPLWKLLRKVNNL